MQKSFKKPVFWGQIYFLQEVLPHRDVGSSFRKALSQADIFLSSYENR